MLLTLDFDYLFEDTRNLVIPRLDDGYRDVQGAFRIRKSPRAQGQDQAGALPEIMVADFGDGRAQLAGETGFQAAQVLAFILKRTALRKMDIGRQYADIALSSR